MILDIGRDYSVLKTRPTPSVLAVLNRLEGRRTWLKSGEGLRVESTNHNLEILMSIPGVEVKKPEEIVPEFEQFSARPVYKEKMPSLDHQKEAWEKSGLKKAFAFLFEQGLGKTKSALDYAGRLFCAGHITAVIILSKKGVHEQWIMSQMPRHLNVEWSGVSWPFEPHHFPKKGLRCVAFNHDAIRTKRGMAVALEFARTHEGKLLIIVDESQDTKNPRTSRYQALMELRPYSSHRVICTGTPISTSLLDLWAQINFIDERIIGIKYITTFKAEYCILGGFQGRAIIGYRNVEKFTSLIEPHMYRITQVEAGLLPPQNEEWVVNLHPAQKKAIRQVKDDLEVSVKEKKIDVATAVVAIGKIAQICSGFVMDEKGAIHKIVPDKDNPKLNAVSDFVAALDGRKAIVWARFREENKMISERLRADGVTHVRYFGETSDIDRTEAVRSFLDPKGAQILVASQSAAGTGLNLQGIANDNFFFSNTLSPIERAQAEARINRIGTVGVVTNTDLIARGGVDRHILNNLRKHKGLAASALGDLIEIISEAGSE